MLVDTTVTVVQYTSVGDDMRVRSFMARHPLKGGYTFSWLVQ